MASRETQCLEAKRAELLKDSMNKKTLEYLYICYTIDANAFFLQVEQLDFRPSYNISILRQTFCYLILIIQFVPEWEIYLKKANSGYL